MPVWLMRQAGRYLPEYKAVREGRSLLEMFHDSSAVVEVTKFPVRRFGMDAAIVFADILSVLDGVGWRWDFCDGRGPVMPDPLPRSPPFFKGQGIGYGYLERAIRELKRELKVPLIGFAGGPFTIASYLIEQGASKEPRQVRAWVYQNRENFHALLEEITEATIRYLRLQIAAGVDALQIFESWAFLLGEREFTHFALPYLAKIVEAIRPSGIPLILFCRGPFFYAQAAAALNPAGLSLDWTIDLQRRALELPTPILQGNLDPVVLLGSHEEIAGEVDRLLKAMHGRPYIFNLGHGVLPETPIDNVAFLVDKVKNAR